MAIATPSNKAGYDADFVSDSLPDRLVCKICHLPSRDPYLSVCCGHLFCKFCLDNVKKAAAIINACPICRNEDFMTFPNKAVDREIKCLHVYCTNKVKGCEWEGELNNISNHLGNSDGCQFEEVKCYNECGKMIERRYLTSHVDTECLCRKVNCQYCHDTGKQQFIDGQHKEECPKLPLPCPNKCEFGSVPREDMEAHRKECSLEMIQCEYHNVGCEVRMARKDQEQHKKEKMEEHLMKTNLALTDIKQELNNTENKVNSTKDELKSTKDQLNNTKVELKNTEDQLNNTKDRLNNTKSELKNELRSTRVELAATKRQLSDTNNQLSSALQRIGKLEIFISLGIGLARPTSSAAVMVSSLEWSVKLVAMAKMFESGDQHCPVISRLSEFAKQKNNNTAYYSDSFYTHDKGYKMCLRIDPNGIGDGEGTHLSCFMYLIKGPHDDKLTWPLKGKFVLKLLNQISDSQHHSTTLIFDNNTPCHCTGRVIIGDKAALGWGSPRFISNIDLHKTTTTRQFLKDDCLFFQVTKLY